MPLIRRRSRFITRPGLLHAITDVGALSGLVLCLDAGDIASYDGTSQQWTDVSGAGNHYNRGATSGAEASDPTFNGTAGAKRATEFFSYDGGDYNAPVAAPTFGGNFHQDNALFTCLAVVAYGSIGTLWRIWATMNATSGTGAAMSINASGSPQIQVRNAGATVRDMGSAVGVLKAGLNYILFSVKEAGGANASFVMLNSKPLFLDATYTSPAAGAAVGNFTVMGSPNGTLSLPVAGSQLAAMAVWSGVALPLGVAYAIYRGLRNRYVI